MNYRQWKKKYKKQHGVKPLGKKEYQYISNIAKEHGISTKEVIKIYYHAAELLCGAFEIVCDTLQRYSATIMKLAEECEKQDVSVNEVFIEEEIIEEGECKIGCKEK